MNGCWAMIGDRANPSLGNTGEGIKETCGIGCERDDRSRPYELRVVLFLVIDEDE